MTSTNPANEDDEGAADGLDDASPTRGYSAQPLVGLGGSAGAMAALTKFLEAMPETSGLAFVVVVHLSRDHDSMLAQLLQRSTRMPVLQVDRTVELEPDRVYVIPPGKALQATDGHLQLADLPEGKGRHVAVDLFFRTLADCHGPHAAAVVLSGLDGDGAIGIKRIKERGGLTIAQDTEEAEHAGMPHSAISTGMVDWVLRVAEMPARLVSYFRRENGLQLPAEAAPAEAGASPAGTESALRDVLTFLRTRTGRDFAAYKRATVVRRIGRRMQVNGVDSIQQYLDCLRTRPGEAGALLQDLLISVTNFFRDASCFEALRARIPKLFAGRGAKDAVRVWVVACATGEEAYSVAMLLLEHARTLDDPPPIQVFATDLDEEALRVAREGVYPPTIEADVSTDLLRRYFAKETRGWRVRRELRELVLFAVHDVLKDSPFSRLDMVTCRNLLIYLNRSAQGRAIDTFHFSLRTDGLLFLGDSEAVDESSSLFRIEDKKNRIYGKLTTLRSGIPVPSSVPVPVGGGPFALSLMAAGAGLASAAGEVAHPAAAASPVLRRGPDWGQMHMLLLEQAGGPSILVNAAHQILHLSQSVGRFLQFSDGNLSGDVLRAVHPDLRGDLRAALHQAQESVVRVHTGGLAVALAGVPVPVDLHVVPMQTASGVFLLVLFDTRASERATAVDRHGRPDPMAHHLELELDRLKAHLVDTVEQYEASNEELKSSNEELQAMNEELRSAGEELETGREELQSINEELTTVNQELKVKVEQLGHANADLQNLMEATAIPTVFLDRDLRITRFTPSAVHLFNLIATDIGRPLAHLSGGLDYPQLNDDAMQVLDRLVPLERELVHATGECYLARVVPYRTLDQRIAGVVLAFIDISSRRKAQEVQEWLSAIVSSSTDAIISFSPDLVIRSWNAGAERVFGYPGAEAIGQPLTLLAPGSPGEFTGSVAELLAGRSIEGQLTRRQRKDGVEIDVLTTLSPIRGADGQVIAGTALLRDVSNELSARRALHASDERLRLMVESAREYAIFSMDLERRITSWSVGAQRLLHYAEDEVVGSQADLIFTAEDRLAGAPQAEAQRALAEGRADGDRYHVRKDGSRFWASGATMPMFDASGVAVGFVKILRDETAQRESEQALQRAQAELQQAHAAKDRFLATLSHELRNPLTSVVSAADLLLVPDLPAEAGRRAAQVVQRQARVMKVQLDDLLDVSRLSLGRMTIQPRPVGLQQVVGAAVEMTRPLIEAAGHELTLQIPQQEIRIDADPVRLAQVIGNLLANATKYTPGGGRLQLAVEAKDGQAQVTVADTGIGMKPEDLERMFELFAQADDAANRAAGGLGIGLALARHIVELHGGWIAAHSEGPGLGTQVRFGLPLHEAAIPPANDPDTRHDVEPPSGSRQRVVLVADDNADAGWAVAELLSHRGFAVLRASDGLQAWDLAQEHRPDAAILDIGMPGLSGHELARRIRDTPWGRGMILVAATGWGQESDVRRSISEGFDAHLTKPLEAASLHNLLAGLLAARGLTEPPRQTS